MRLGHRRLGPVQDVLHELLAIRKLDLLTVDEPRFLLVDQDTNYCPRVAS